MHFVGFARSLLKHGLLSYIDVYGYTILARGGCGGNFGDFLFAFRTTKPL